MAILQAVTDCWSEPLEDDGTVVVLCVASAEVSNSQRPVGAGGRWVTRILDRHSEAGARPEGDEASSSSSTRTRREGATEWRLFSRRC
jgi:hypothetical protein